MAPDEWYFTVDGDPVPKGRPRVYRSNTITPQRTLDYELRVRIAARNACPGRRPIPAGHQVEIKCWFRQATRRREDIDNLLKTVMDALNGLCYVDDSQVYRTVDVDQLPGDYRANQKPGIDVYVRDMTAHLNEVNDDER